MIGPPRTTNTSNTTIVVQRDSTRPDRNIHAVNSVNGCSRSANSNLDSQNSRHGGDRAESALHNRDPGFDADVAKRITEYDRKHFSHGSHPRAIVPNDEYSTY